MKITVVLEAFVQTSYETYTHKYRTVDIEVPDDGNEWHVAGEICDTLRGVIKVLETEMEAET